jgi:hypothetical protein
VERLRAEPSGGTLFSNASLNKVAVGFTMGGISAGVTYGIGHGNDGGEIFDSFWGTAVAQGIIAEAAGGDFFSGFASGFIGHAAGGAIGGIGGGGAIVARTTVAAMFGGLAAEATGGNFEDVAFQAAMVHLFNTEAGRLAQKEDLLTSDAAYVARTLYGEFPRHKDQYLEATAWIIRNRVESDLFPDTYKDVATDSAQFSSWNKNDPNSPRVLNPDVSDPKYLRAYRIAKAVLAAPASQNPIPNIYHYYSPRSMAGGIDPYWAKSGMKVYVDGIKEDHMTFVKFKHGTW